MITVTVTKNDDVIFTHEISSFSINEVLSVMLTGGYVNPNIPKNSLCNVTISDGVTPINKQCTFLSYQFNVQTYQQTDTEGNTQTLTGVTNNSLIFNLLSE